MQNSQNKSEKIWRLIKVIYFIITLPIVLAIASWLTINIKISRGPFIQVNDYYIGILYAIGAILTYIAFTDWIRRIASYVNKGELIGLFSYRIFLQKYLINIAIILFIATSILLGLSQSLQNECTGANEEFNQMWICSCEKGFTKNTQNKCEIILEQSIQNSIPNGAFLREYKSIPGNENLYVGIYINNYEIDPPTNTNNNMPYSSCTEEVQWQWIEWEYHIFSFQNGKIISDKLIPTEFRNQLTPWAKLNLSYINTRLNNYSFFNGDKPESEKEKYSIEKTSLINFKDYNGDKRPYEFTILDHWDQSCGHNNYLIAWINPDTQEIIFYGIEWKDGEVSHWGDNFIPNEHWQVENWWECGDHWATNYKKMGYFYSRISQRFINTEETEWSCNYINTKWEIILQDVNLRKQPSINSKIIRPILKDEIVFINKSTEAESQKWYNITTSGTSGWISEVGFRKINK